MKTEQAVEYIDQSDAELLAEKTKLEKQTKLICKQRDDLNNQIIALRAKIDAIDTVQTDRIVLRMSNRAPADQDWDWLLFEDGLSHRGKARTDALAKLGLSASGYYPDLNQACVRISLEQDNLEQIEQVTRGLSIVLPFIKDVKDGYKRISIFEETLSEHGIWTLQVYPDKYVLNKMTYGRGHDIKTFEHLHNMIAFIAKNNPAPSYKECD